MTDLATALAAVGERAPERPYVVAGCARSKNKDDYSDAEIYAVALESLALRLAVRLAATLPPCHMCCGRGWDENLHEGLREPTVYKCASCHGTGKRQGR